MTPGTWHKMEHVLNAVADERVRQEELWGEQNHRPEVWSMILGEEVGELNEAMNRHYFLKDPNAHRDMRDEAIQVAAVAVAFVEALDRNGGWVL